MKQTFSVAAALLATFSISSAQDTIKCDSQNLCPQSAPCCSQYGQCGVGAYCLGGCDPTASFSLQSCVAAPVCKSGDFKMDSLDDVQANSVYLGDSSKANWVSSGNPVTYNGDSILLTMAPSTVGTLLTSTHYVWYGKISVTMTSSEGQGVVSAAILMSDVKDEIDFEFVGSDVQHAQSNYYWQGVTDYDNMKLLAAANTRSNVHTYTVDWSEDSIIWSVDGDEMRTLNKADTWNSTTNSFHFPQTPSRVQLSLWPAGLSKNGQGTIDWAGGLIDWDSSYMQNGYYYAMVNDVNIECYDPPSGVDTSGSAYYYTSRVGTNATVAIGDNSTILSSFYATGDNPTFNPDAKASAKPSASGSSTASMASMTSTPNTIPGVSGGGNAASSGESPNGQSNAGASGSSSSSGSGSSSGTTSSSGSGSFSQGDSSTGSTGSSSAPKVVAGSAVALLGFFVAALML